MKRWDHLRYFKPEEFTRPDQMHPHLMYLLDSARADAGVPFVITSSFREDDPRTHGLGEAVDIKCHHPYVRWRILPALLRAGFHRIGIYLRHIHVDIGLEPRFPSNVIWYGEYDETWQDEQKEESKGVHSRSDASAPEESSPPPNARGHQAIDVYGLKEPS